MNQIITNQTCDGCIYIKFLGSGRCSCEKIGLMLTDLQRLTLCKRNNLKTIETAPIRPLPIHKSQFHSVMGSTYSIVRYAQMRHL